MKKRVKQHRHIHVYCTPTFILNLWWDDTACMHINTRGGTDASVRQCVRGRGSVHLFCVCVFMCTACLGHGLNGVDSRANRGDDHGDLVWLQTQNLSPASSSPLPPLPFPPPRVLHITENQKWQQETDWECTGQTRSGTVMSLYRVFVFSLSLSLQGLKHTGLMRDGYRERVKYGFPF